MGLMKYPPQNNYISKELKETMMQEWGLSEFASHSVILHLHLTFIG